MASMDTSFDVCKKAKGKGPSVPQSRAGPTRLRRKCVQTCSNEMVKTKKNETKKNTRNTNKEEPGFAKDYVLYLWFIFKRPFVAPGFGWLQI